MSHSRLHESLCKRKKRACLTVRDTRVKSPEYCTQHVLGGSLTWFQQQLVCSQTVRGGSSCPVCSLQLFSNIQWLHDPRSYWNKWELACSLSPRPLAALWRKLTTCREQMSFESFKGAERFGSNINPRYSAKQMIGGFPFPVLTSLCSSSFCFLALNIRIVIPSCKQPTLAFEFGQHFLLLSDCVCQTECVFADCLD